MVAVKNTTVYLGIGSNEGNLRQNLCEACLFLKERALSGLLRASSLYKTSPVGPRQRDYLNAVVKIRTALEPLEFLREIKKYEHKAGRKKNMRWGPRLIDIDILFWGRDKVNKKGLFIPHREIHKRRFVLEPLCEITPGLVHPIYGKTARKMLQAAKLAYPEQKVRMAGKIKLGY